MISISPEQIVYTRIRRICKNLGYSTFDYLPGSDVEYPFVVLGEQFSQPFREHKDWRNKYVQTTVHVWHNDWKKRGTVSKIMQEIELEIIKEFGIAGENISMQVLPDNSTGSRFWHGVLETDIKI